MHIPRMRAWPPLGLAISLLLGLPVGGFAASSSPLGLTDCGAAEGVFQCSGLVETWDGVPLDTTVTLPSEGARNLPLVAELHGFGNSKYEYLDPASTAYTDNAFAWARDGYAVLTFTARGLWGSCGTPESRAASPAGCANGYLHLADVRYEVRDAQELIGRLVDEGYAAAGRIGVTGDSYGGGQTLMLAALRDRVMLFDGSLAPWKSPRGRPLRVAAAAPVIPWSDLVTAAAPNGRVSPTSVTDGPTAHSPVGVSKGSFVNGIAVAAQNATGPGQPVGEPFTPGRPMGYVAPGTDPEANILGWVARIDAGEPYTDPLAAEVIRLARDYHSAYFIDPSHAPPPLFIGSGFTDDLFPVDEALRFANRTRRMYPKTPVSLFFGDFGHQRAANKAAERKELLARIHGWFDRYLRGVGSPRRGVTAYAGTCPADATSFGPYFSPTFAGLARREVVYVSLEPHTVSSLGGDPRVAQSIDPVTGSVCASTPADAAAPGTARYELRKKGSPAWTLIGAPRLTAGLTVTGVLAENAQLDARLWDVGPDGMQHLVARGTYRPSNGPNQWWLHPAAWFFGKDHSAVLELVGADAPYVRPSNGVFQIEVHSLRVSLPAR